jgi:hypothetical protein
MVAFALPNSEDSVCTDSRISWVFSTKDDRLGWSSLHIGLRPLLISMGPYIVSALDLLGPVFLNGSFNRVSHTLQGIPQIWKEFFKLEGYGAGCDSTGTHEVFQASVSILIQLRELEPISSNLFKNLQFWEKFNRSSSLCCMVGIKSTVAI